MGQLRIVQSGWLWLVSCSGWGVSLSAEDCVHLEFWGILKGYKNARALKAWQLLLPFLLLRIPLLLPSSLCSSSSPPPPASLLQFPPAAPLLVLLLPLMPICPLLDFWLLVRDTQMRNIGLTSKNLTPLISRKSPKDISASPSPLSFFLTCLVLGGWKGLGRRRMVVDIRPQ